MRQRTLNDGHSLTTACGSETHATEPVTLVGFKQDYEEESSLLSPFSLLLVMFAWNVRLVRRGLNSEGFSHDPH
jgi:hypothetical protein